MYDTTSKYEEGIVDDLIFVSDIDYSHKNIETIHATLLAEEKYTEAADYLNAQTEVTPITAALFNLITNRIRATQNYLLTKQQASSMVISNEEPSNPNKTTNWIADE